MEKDIVEFYHVVDDFERPEDIDKIASFKQKGAVPQTQAIANGGQSGGFFVWVSKEASHHHSLYLGGTSHLQIGIKVPESSVKYPTWQVDLENISVGGIFKRHEDELKKIPQIDCMVYDVFGQNPKPDCFKVLGVMEDGSVEIVSPTTGKRILEQKDLNCLSQIEAILTSAAEKFPDVKDDYNQGLKRLVHLNGALKYRGDKPLPISSITILENHYRPKGVSETVIFDSEKNASKQNCPFISAGQFLSKKAVNR